MNLSLCLRALTTATIVLAIGGLVLGRRALRGEVEGHAIVDGANREVPSAERGFDHRDVAFRDLEGLRNLHSAEELSARRGKQLRSFIPGQPSPQMAAEATDGR